MKNVIKKSVGIAIVLGMALGMAVPAMAATVSSPLFSNGQTTIDATGGTTVNGTFTLTVGSGEVVEWLRSQADTQPFTDTSVGGTLGYQEGVYTNVPFTVKVPPNTGTYNVNEQGAGTFGGNRSINGGDNVVFGFTNVGSVRVVANGDSTSGSTSSFQSLTDLVASLAAQVQALLHPATAPVATTTAQCLAVSAKLVGTMQGVRNDANVRLQGFLLSEGASIPALSAGASFGFYGPQTMAAVAQYNAINSCH